MATNQCPSRCARADSPGAAPNVTTEAIGLQRRSAKPVETMVIDAQAMAAVHHHRGRVIHRRGAVVNGGGWGGVRRRRGGAGNMWGVWCIKWGGVARSTPAAEVPDTPVAPCTPAVPHTPGPGGRR